MHLDRQQQLQLEMASTYQNNPKWVKRMEILFEQNDMDKDGRVTLEDFEAWSDNIEREASATPELFQKARRATREFWVSTGLEPGVSITRDQFVTQMSEFIPKEKAKFDEGKDPMFFKFMDATFDVLDSDKDGYLNMDEHATMMKVSNFDPSAAMQAFNTVDTNHDGRIARQQFKDFNLAFWFIPDDAKAEGMYGPKFE